MLLIHRINGRFTHLLCCMFLIFSYVVCHPLLVTLSSGNPTEDSMPIQEQQTFFSYANLFSILAPIISLGICALFSWSIYITHQACHTYKHMYGRTQYRWHNLLRSILFFFSKLHIFIFLLFAYMWLSW